jgi:hypothetical protein
MAAYGDKHPYTKDLKKLDTRRGARRTSQESLDAARTQAAGAPAPSYDPVQHAQLGRQIESNAKRWVMGRHENKGRSPMTVLSPHQWSEFQTTGDVAGLFPGYGAHSAGPDDREWEKP